MRQTPPPSTPNIQVIERMFALIDVLASREEAISLKEISERTGLHPSTAHRILNDLAVGGLVEGDVARQVEDVVERVAGAAEAGQR